MTAELDEKFGEIRHPDRIDEWEDRVPDSLSTLDVDLATSLAELEKLVQCKLLKSAARAKNYIWAMAPDGEIRIAIEELAVQQPEATFSGYPRRRGYKHPSEEKKLGHPTLLQGKGARIAGELAFDELDGRLRWVFNVNSGRYCRARPPSDLQIKQAAERFRELGLDVFVDYD